MASRRPVAPSLQDELVALLGAAAAGQLLTDFGGREIYVPREPGEHHPITVAIGAAAAAKLADAYHGTSLELPLPRDKARRILDLADDPMLRRQDIARRVGCTERWVYKVLEGRQRAGQRDLFT